MDNRTAGIIGMLCAPFLFIDLMVNEMNETHWTSGLFSVIYMGGWMLSIISLYKLRAIGKSVMVIQLILLSIAQIANLIVLGGINGRPVWFEILDLSWPASNAFMLVIGITVLARKKIQGWKKFIPLFVGLWLPSLIMAIALLSTKEEAKLFLGIYSACAWTLLAILIYTTEGNSNKQHQVAIA